jgi:hypothetical protein
LSCGGTTFIKQLPSVGELFAWEETVSRCRHELVNQRKQDLFEFLLFPRSACRLSLAKVSGTSERAADEFGSVAISEPQEPGIVAVINPSF